MSDEIHAARWVRKTHSVSAGAFASPVSGPVGFVVEGEPSIWWHQPGRITPHATVDSKLTVALVTVCLDDDGGLVRAIDERYAGAVVAGFGAGHVPASMVEPLERLAARIPVVLASRIGVGPVLTATYGFDGSESDLQGRGLIGAGFLDAYKARLLLQVLLSAGAGRAEIATTFRTAGFRTAGRG
jgi:L-asparaginase